MANKAKAKKIFLQYKGKLTVRELAAKSKNTIKDCRKWVKEWADLVDRREFTEKMVTAIDQKAEELGLTELERLWSFHYLKVFNKKQAAVNAGCPPSSSYKMGGEIFRRPRVKEFLRYIKGIRDGELFYDGIRIIENYIKIAEADITDYVKFNRYNVQLKNSEHVDGTLIEEVSEGREGVKIKLYSKMPALKRLEDYFLDNSLDNRRIEIEKKKLDIYKAKLMLEIENTKKSNQTQEDVKILKRKMRERRESKKSS